MAQQVHVSIEHGDITTIDADVIALKFARHSHGADAVVSSKLIPLGIAAESLRPSIGHSRLVATKGAVTARSALFVGTPSIYDMTYADIQALATTALSFLKTEAPQTTHVAMTIHGPGFGLDEIESCLSQLKGYQEAVRTGDYPPALRRITIVDRDPGRVDRLRKGVAASGFVLELHPGEKGGRNTLPAPSEMVKPHAFVAMSFSPHMADVYHYGIQTPVHAAGLLCERMDHLSFTGEIIEWMKRKIETATVVIAEISEVNPNVYLEVGYAWGKGRPTILLAQDIANMAFDVRGHRCLQYDRITTLEQVLSRELTELRASTCLA
jgi:nucleoside 2-deoxyribosyltransferase